MCKRTKALLVAALCVTTFSASCSRSANDRIIEAETRRAIAESVQLPGLPERCRQEHNYQPQEGEALVVALAMIGEDRRAYRNQTRFCAEWYDALQGGVNEKFIQDLQG